MIVSFIEGEIDRRGFTYKEAFMQRYLNLTAMTKQKPLLMCGKTLQCQVIKVSWLWYKVEIGSKKQISVCVYAWGSNGCLLLSANPALTYYHSVSVILYYAPIATIAV